MINLSSQVDPLAITRRQFFSKTSRGLGVLGLASLFPKTLFGAASQNSIGGLPGFPNFPAKAKRVIYLFQSGAPSQMDLFDYKPLLNKLNGEQLPEHVRGDAAQVVESCDSTSAIDLVRRGRPGPLA